MYITWVDLSQLKAPLLRADGAESFLLEELVQRHRITRWVPTSIQEKLCGDARALCEIRDLLAGWITALGCQAEVVNVN